MGEIAYYAFVCIQPIGSPVQHDRDDYFNRMDCTECLTNRWSAPLAGMKSRMSKLESKKWRRKLAAASRRLAVESGG